jgi:hypothetical protein
MAQPESTDYTATTILGGHGHLHRHAIRDMDFEQRRGRIRDDPEDI